MSFCFTTNFAISISLTDKLIFWVLQKNLSPAHQKALPNGVFESPVSTSIYKFECMPIRIICYYLHSCTASCPLIRIGKSGIKQTYLWELQTYVKSCPLLRVMIFPVILLCIPCVLQTCHSLAVYLQSFFSGDKEMVSFDDDLYLCTRHHP